MTAYLTIRLTTSTMPTLSTKGQIVIPADVRRRHGWKPGQRLDFVDAGRDVLLRSADTAPVFPPTSRADVRAVLAYDGPRIPLDELGIGGLDPDADGAPRP